MRDFMSCVRYVKDKNCIVFKQFVANEHGTGKLYSDIRYSSLAADEWKKFISNCGTYQLFYEEQVYNEDGTCKTKIVKRKLEVARKIFDAH